MTSETWRRNLIAMSIAEFVVIFGIDGVQVLLPLFIQDLGNYEAADAAFWGGIATGVTGVGSFVAAPLWGMVSDRWGRKNMVLRAMFSATAIAVLSGLAPSVSYLIAFRFAHGLLAGVVSASSALVAAGTPREKVPMAMGSLMAASFAGQTLGPMLGGLVADRFGFVPTFFVSGAAIFSGAIIVLLFVKERFECPKKEQRSSLGAMLGLARSREVLVLLLALAALQAAPKIISPLIPMLIKDISPTAQAASAAGLTFGLMGIVAGISSLAAGRLARRFTLRNILIFSCLGTSLLYLPPIWAGTVAQLLLLVALTGLLKGGLVVSPSALVGLSVDPSRQGVAYGLAQSAKALGNAVGPLIGGSVAPLFGLRSGFVVASMFFLVVGLALTRTSLEKPAVRAGK